MMSHMRYFMLHRVYVMLLFLSAVIGLRAQINADGVIRIGRNALYYEDYALSILYFNQAIAAKPYLYAPYYYRAIAKYYLGDYYGAVGDCSLSIDRDPYISEVYRLRAINYIRINDYQAASEDYYTLINERGEKDRDVWYNLVLCQSHIDHLQEADRLLDTMIVRWPDFARSYLLKAQIAMSEGDTVRALSLIDKTISVDSNDVDAIAAKALLCLQHERYDEAERAYDRAIFLSPRTPTYYINRALTRYRQKNLRGAMDDYNVALQLMPESYLAHYNRALLRMQVGENNLAIEDFDFVLQKRPSDRMALYNRAILSQQTGDYRRAIRDYTTIIKDFPDFSGAYVNRSYCYRRLGETRRSEADDRRVVEIRLNEVYNKKTYKSPLDAATRGEGDDDIENYDKLVTDNEEGIVPFYASEYRGKVQNREVAVEYQPLYNLTFAKADNGLYSSGASSKAQFLDNINKIEQLYDRLSLSCKEGKMLPSDIEKMRTSAQMVASQLEKTSSSAPLLLVHALYMMAERDYDSALQDLNQCIDHKPHMTEAYFLRGVVKQKIAEVQNLKTPQPAQSSVPNDVMRFNYTTAVADFTAAIDEEPDCAYLYYNRGCIKSLLLDYEGAIADFAEAIKLNSSLAEAYYNRGLCLVNSGDTVSGIKDLSKAGELGIFTAYSLIKHFRKE